MKMKFCKGIRNALLDIEIVYSDFWIQMAFHGITIWLRGQFDILQSKERFPVPSIVRSPRLTCDYLVSLNLAASKASHFLHSCYRAKLTLVSLRRGSVLRYLHQCTERLGRINREMPSIYAMPEFNNVAFGVRPRTINCVQSTVCCALDCCRTRCVKLRPCSQAQGASQPPTLASVKTCRMVNVHCIGDQLSFHIVSDKDNHASLGGC